MGGFGSGRPSGTGLGKVESCRSIDVNKLNKAGILQPGYVQGWQWKSDGKQVAQINMRAEVGWLHLSYRVRIAGGAWECIEEPIRIIRLPCSYGGSRPYFLCPRVRKGITCNRRVVKLHGATRYFLCRHCSHIAYASQSEGVWDRALRSARKTKQRLGGDPDMPFLFPPKPKGMWRRTYERLRSETFNAEVQAEDAFSIQAEKLFARIRHLESKCSN